MNVRPVQKLFVILAVCRALAAQDQGALEGHVLNTTTGSGLAAVRVTVQTAAGNLTATVFTDDSGLFHTGNLREGDYRITFLKNGFVLPRQAARDAIVHVIGDATTRVDASLAPWAKIRGRVLDPEGKPAAGAVVRIIPAFDGETTAGDDGTFSFDDLKPGSYVLAASVVTKEDQPARGTAIVTTYFPSTIAREQAREIQLDGGDDLSGFEIQLRTAPVFRVRGTVLDISGKPLPLAKVTLFRPGAGHVTMNLGGAITIPEPIEELHAEAGPEGEFEFPSATAGEWIARAGVTEYDDVHQRNWMHNSRALPVHLTREDAENVELRIEPAFAVDVTVGTDNPQTAQSLPVLHAQLNLVALDGQRGGSTVMDGPRLENLVPGRYAVIPNGRPPDDLYLAAVLLGGRDVFGQEITLLGPAELKIVYKSGAGSVRGSVKNGAGVFVYLVPQVQGSADIAYSDDVRANGSFALSGVPPGDYYAGAFGQIDRANPEFGAALRASGARVHVEAGSVVTLDLDLLR